MVKIASKIILSTAVLLGTITGGLTSSHFLVQHPPNAQNMPQEPINKDPLTQGVPIEIGNLTLNFTNKVIDKNNNLLVLANDNAIKKSEVVSVGANDLKIHSIISLSQLFPEDYDNKIMAYNKPQNILAVLNPLSTTSKIEFMDLTTNSEILSVDVNTNYKNIADLQWYHQDLWYSVFNQNGISMVDQVHFLKNNQTQVIHYPLPADWHPNVQTTHIGFVLQTYKEFQYLWLWNTGQGSITQSLYREIIDNGSVLKSSITQITTQPPNQDKKVLFALDPAIFQTDNSGNMYITTQWGSLTFNEAELWVAYLGNHFQLVSGFAAGNECQYIGAINNNKTLVFSSKDENNFYYSFINDDNSGQAIYRTKLISKDNLGNFMVTSAGQLTFLNITYEDSANSQLSIVKDPWDRSAASTRITPILHSDLDLASIPDEYQSQHTIITDQFSNMFIFSHNYMYKVFYSDNTVLQTWMVFNYGNDTRYIWIKPNILTSNQNLTATIDNENAETIAVNSTTQKEDNKHWSLSFHNSSSNTNSEYDVQGTYNFNGQPYHGQLQIGILEKEPQIDVNTVSDGQKINNYVGHFPTPSNQPLNFTHINLVYDFYFARQQVNVKPNIDLNTADINQTVMTWVALNKDFQPMTATPHVVTDNSKGQDFDGKDSPANGLYQITVTNQVQPTHIIYLQIANQPAPLVTDFWQTNEGKKFAAEVKSNPHLFNMKLSAMQKLDARDLNQYITIANNHKLGANSITHSNFGVGKIIGLVVGLTAAAGLIIALLFLYPRIKVKIIAYKNKKKRNQT